MSKDGDEVIRAKAIEVEEFRLVDQDGRVKVRIGLADEGAVNLRFFDGSDGVRVQIGLGKNGIPLIGMLNGNGAPAIMLGAAEDGESNVV